MYVCYPHIVAKDLVQWASRPISKKTVKTVGVLAGVAVGATVLWYIVNAEEIERAGGLVRALFEGTTTPPTGKRGSPGTKGPVPKGTVLCPAEVGKIPPDISAVRRGDYVILELVSKNGKFVEPTWARVRSVSPDREQLYVEIVGEFTKAGIKPISSKKHGFYLGEKLIVDSDCVFDTLHISGELKGQILCGPSLGAIVSETTQEPLYRPVDTRRVSTSNLVKIVAASKEGDGTAWHEPLWVHVTRISPTSQIIHGIVSEEPELTAKHGLRQFSAVQFGRDCVVDVSNPYLVGDS